MSQDGACVCSIEKLGGHPLSFNTESVAVAWPPCAVLKNIDDGRLVA